VRKQELCQCLVSLYSQKVLNVTLLLPVSLFLTPTGVQKCEDLQLSFTDLFGGNGSVIIQKVIS